MSEMPLFDAMRLLANLHTAPSKKGFRVKLFVTAPEAGDFQKLEAAWAAIRKAIGYQTEPEPDA